MSVWLVRDRATGRDGLLYPCACNGTCDSRPHGLLIVDDGRELRVLAEDVELVTDRAPAST